MDSVLGSDGEFSGNKRALTRRKWIIGMSAAGAAGVMAPGVQDNDSSGRDGLNFIEDFSNTDEIGEVDFSYDGEKLRIGDVSDVGPEITVIGIETEEIKFSDYELNDETITFGDEEALYIAVNTDDDDNIYDSSAIFNPSEGVDEYEGRLWKEYTEQKNL